MAQLGRPGLPPERTGEVWKDGGRAIVPGSCQGTGEDSRFGLNLETRVLGSQPR